MNIQASRDFIDRRHGVYERAREEVAKGNRIGIGIPVLAELAFGIEQSKSRDRNMQSLRTALAAWKLWPFDETAAFETYNLLVTVFTAMPSGRLSTSTRPPGITAPVEPLMTAR